MSSILFEKVVWSPIARTTERWYRVNERDSKGVEAGTMAPLSYGLGFQVAQLRASNTRRLSSPVHGPLVRNSLMMRRIVSGNKILRTAFLYVFHACARQHGSGAIRRSAGLAAAMLRQQANSCDLEMRSVKQSSGRQQLGCSSIYLLSLLSDCLSLATLL